MGMCVYIHVCVCEAAVSKKGTDTHGGAPSNCLYCTVALGKYFQHLNACFKYYSIVIGSSSQSYAIFMKLRDLDRGTWVRLKARQQSESSVLTDRMY